MNHIISFILLLFITTLLKCVSSQDCEGIDASRCTCHMMYTLDYLNDKANVPYHMLQREPNIVSRQISNYHCVRYHTLPATLRISLTQGHDDLPPQIYYHSQPRMKRSIGWKPVKEQEDSALQSNDYGVSKRRRNKRQTPLGYPSNELFSQVIPKLDDRADHVYIPLGGRATLHCGSGPHNAMIESGGGPIFKKHFEWTHSDGRIVSSPEVTMDGRNGDVFFQAVQLSDSDLYNCNVSYALGLSLFDDHDPDNPTPADLPPSEIFNQQLDVVAEPIQWLRFVVEYYTDHCSREELKLINSHIVGWVHHHVCFFCPVRNHSVACLSSDSGSGSDDVDEDNSLSSNQKKVMIRLAVSTLGLERKMMAFSSYSEACPLSCIELLHGKILQIVRDSLEKLFGLWLYIEVESSHGPPDVSGYAPGAISADFVIGCPAGFYQTHKLCFPCGPGQFSPDGKSECFRCVVGTFQPTPGSGMCLSCPDGFSTLGEGTVGEFDCKRDIITFSGKLVQLWAKYYPWSIILLILPCLILLVCIIPCICPKTRIGRWFASCSCCGPDPDFDENKEEDDILKGHKIGKRRSYEVVEEYENEEEGGENESGTRKDVIHLREVRSFQGRDQDDAVKAKVNPPQKSTLFVNEVSQNQDLIQVEVQDTAKSRVDNSNVKEIKNDTVSVIRTEKLLPKRVKSSSKIPKPPPLPVFPTSYWNSTQKNSKVNQKSYKRAPLQKPTTDSQFQLESEAGKNKEVMKTLKLSPTQRNDFTQTSRTNLELPKLRHVERQEISEDKGNNASIFSTDDETRQRSVKEHTERLDHVKSIPNNATKRQMTVPCNRCSSSRVASSAVENDTDHTELLDRRKVARDLEVDKRRKQRNVNFDPIAKTRIIPCRAIMPSSSEDETARGTETDTTNGAIDVRKLARRLNYQKVGHVSIRPSSNHNWNRPLPEKVVKLKELRSISSEFDINAPIDVKKIARRLEKRRKFSAGMLEDLTMRGKIPPGAFTYTPPLPMANSGVR